jgi:hypothetical protein
MPLIAAPNIHSGAATTVTLATQVAEQVGGDARAFAFLD